MSWSLWVIIFLFIGLILLMCEVFLIPGFGPVGIAALLFLGIGTYMAWKTLHVTVAITITLVSISSVIASIIFFKKSGLATKLVLGHRIEDNAAPDSQEHKETSPLNVGDVGSTVSDIRPTGIAEFHNQRVNVMTDGIYIERNTRVKIVLIEGNRIFIEEA
ncbi:MAG: NfeD family protein [bacterium]